MSKSAIAAEALGLEPGQQVRTVCPFYQGGSSSERTLSIKLDAETGLILYHCFRGNCGESGVLGGAKSLIRIREEAPKQKPPFDASWVVGPSLAEDLDFVAIEQKLMSWGMDFGSYSWMYEGPSRRLAIPVYGPIAELRGYVLRAIHDWQKPKALTGVIRREGPFISWHYPRQGPYDSGLIVCVEDVPSAIRVSQCGITAVALLGNTPSDAALDEIAGVAGNRKVVFALDPDANVQSLRLVKQFGMRGIATSMFIPKDFKNMTNEEAKGWLESVS